MRPHQLRRPAPALLQLVREAAPLPAAAAARRRRPARRAAAAAAAAGSKETVLVIGSGGREHSLAWRLAQSPSCGRLFVAPGNAGTALEPGVTTLPALRVADAGAVVEFCRREGVTFVLVGPEQPLVDGLVDALEAAGVTAFGPTAAAARLEGSKAFMKDLCRKHGIDTAGYGVFSDAAEAKAYVRAHGAPIVVKASGLAAGKGVVVAATVDEACAAVDSMLVGGAFGGAGAVVVIEEFLAGEEASLFALVDGEACVPLAGAQDHKAVGDGDVGPNTGGMGSYSPAPVLPPALVDAAMRDIVRPTAAAMVAEGAPFRGVLFAGLMVDAPRGGGGAPRVRLLEHNVRFGDPECQSLMMRLRSDLLEALLAATRREEPRLEWAPDAALTVVLAARGYPGDYERGAAIAGLDAAAAVPGAKVFHAGTALDAGGRVVSAGGRVLGVSATGATVAAAQAAAYAAVDAIDFPGGFCRRDIGHRAVARERAAAGGGA